MGFIVIEGLDGSGKSTQLKLLKEYLEKEHIAFKYLHFPRTEDGVFGDLVARFLRGELGNIEQVNAYLVGLIYAGDRNDAKDMINKWLADDNLVIIDRYVYSNMAFQGAKLKSKKEKLALIDWLKKLEYEYYKIPQPELSIFLDVPFSFTTQNLKNQREGENRAYLKGKEDIHEADLNFQEQVRQEYLGLIKNDEQFICINCYDEKDKKMLPAEQIFLKIIETLKQHNVI